MNGVVNIKYHGPEKDRAYFHALFKSFFSGFDIKVSICSEEDADSAIAGLSDDMAENGLHKCSFSDVTEPAFFILRIKDEGYFITGSDGTEPAAAERHISLPAGSDKDRTEVFKHFVYECLCYILDKHLPWGSLMGVRPTKLARKIIEQAYADYVNHNGEFISGSGDKTEDQDPDGTFSSDEMWSQSELRSSILKYYVNRYGVSPDKAGTATDIAYRENKVIRSLNRRNGFSLYVGIPFCPTRCLYCSFTSNPIAACRHLTGPVVETMLKEIGETADILKGRCPDTIYVGGGTPTALCAEDLERILAGINESFDMSGLLEFTVEAGRADSITREKLKVIKEAGATRISVNPQTMNPETLDLIGRKGSPEEVTEAFYMAREEGFSHINMDIILGLPGENTLMAAHTLDRIKELSPDSLTVHSLAVKRGSDLHRNLIEKGISMQQDTSKAMELAYEAAADIGLVPYYLYRQKNMTGNLENVGFAREGEFGIYNILVMEEVQDVVAIGPGGISKRVTEKGPFGDVVRIERCENVRELEVYINRMDDMLQRKRELFTAD